MMDYSIESKCGKCKELLPLERFNKKQSYCKSCISEYSKSPVRREYMKNYRENPENKEKFDLYNRRESLRGRWKVRKKKLEKILYYESITEQVCKTCGELKPLSEYWKDTTKISGRSYHCSSCSYVKSKPIVKRKRDYKYENDEIFRVSNLLRNHIYRYLDGQKNKSTEEILGITVEEFTEYLEGKFQEGMTWDNQGEWVLDHIVPLSLGETVEELYKLNHYTNFQPLWEKDNRKKFNHLLSEHYSLYETLLGKKVEKKLVK